MKKIFSILLTAILAVMLSSCTSPRKQLEDCIKSVNAACPQKVAPGVSITDYFLESDYMVISYLCDDSQMPAESLYKGLNGDSFKQMAAADKNGLQLLELMAKADIGLKYRVSGSNSGFRKDLSFESKDIKTWISSIKNGEVSGSDASFIASTMAAAKNGCPMQVDEITIMTDCGFENNVVYYVYSIIESNELSVDDLDEDAMYEILLQGLTDKNNPAVRLLIERVQKINGQFRYTYVGDKTGQSLEVIFDAKDL